MASILMMGSSLSNFKASVPVKLKSVRSTVNVFKTCTARTSVVEFLLSVGHEYFTARDTWAPKTSTSSVNGHEYFTAQDTRASKTSTSSVNGHEYFTAQDIWASKTLISPLNASTAVTCIDTGYLPTCIGLNGCNWFSKSARRNLQRSFNDVATCPPTIRRNLIATFNQVESILDRTLESVAVQSLHRFLAYVTRTELAETSRVMSRANNIVAVTNCGTACQIDLQDSLGKQFSCFGDCFKMPAEPWLMSDGPASMETGYPEHQYTKMSSVLPSHPSLSHASWPPTVARNLMEDFIRVGDSYTFLPPAGPPIVGSAVPAMSPREVASIPQPANQLMAVTRGGTAHIVKLQDRLASQFSFFGDFYATPMKVSPVKYCPISIDIDVEQRCTKSSMGCSSERVTSESTRLHDTAAKSVLATEPKSEPALVRRPELFGTPRAITPRAHHMVVVTNGGTACLVGLEGSLRNQPSSLGDCFKMPAEPWLMSYGPASMETGYPEHYQYTKMSSVLPSDPTLSHASWPLTAARNLMEAFNRSSDPQQFFLTNPRSMQPTMAPGELASSPQPANNKPMAVTHGGTAHIVKLQDRPECQFSCLQESNDTCPVQYRPTSITIELEEGPTEIMSAGGCPVMPATFIDSLRLHGTARTTVQATEPAWDPMMAACSSAIRRNLMDLFNDNEVSSNTSIELLAAIN